MQYSELTFSAHMSLAEFETAHRQYLRKRLLSVKNLVVMTVVLLMSAAQAALFGGKDWAFTTLVLLWIGIVIACALAYVRLPGKLYRRLAKHEGPWTWRATPHELEIERGTAVQKKDSHQWSDLKGWDQSHEYLFLMFADGSPPEAIPRAALGGQQGELLELSRRAKAETA